MRSGSPRWRWETSPRMPTSTRSWRRAAPTCACSRAPICGPPLGPGMRPSSSRIVCPGRTPTSRSTTSGPGSHSLGGGIDMPLTYSSYLELDELLALQQPVSDGPEHDETLFIVIHQVYELWF